MFNRRKGDHPIKWLTKTATFYYPVILLTLFLGIGLAAVSGYIAFGFVPTLGELMSLCIAVVILTLVLIRIDVDEE